ncbi:MAG TPA: hypothetical protein VKK81_04030 [Candidatus Binatia bacterium]|nr:hypothetical protein [Candidatus Binatia bacterium]
MRRLTDLQVPFLFVLCLALGSALLVAGQSGEKKWDFDSDVEGKPPAGFTFARTGQGSEGQWVVKKDDSAPSKPHVLAQTSQDKTDYRFPLAIAEGTNYKDLALSVKFKTISGSVDQGAGLVFRLKDKDNYYVVRANALEDNFRLYHVLNGRRVQFAGANLKVTSQTWHEIKVEARGNEFKCSYDGQVRITAKDSTFTEAGKIGLWTKADSVIHFDDLTVREFGATASAVPPAKTLGQHLVEELAARHAELLRIGLHVTPPNSKQNVIIASNVAAKVGQKSDPEDLKAIETRKPVVLREGENFDITLPLHDSAGNIIGAIGLTFRPRPGEQESDAVGRATKTARELERRIPSKARLFDSIK